MLLTCFLWAGVLADRGVAAAAESLQVLRPAFSFRYDGRASQGLIETWPHTETRTRIDAQRSQKQRVYTDPRTGLEVTCQATEYADFPAVEWVLFFENKGPTDTPILEEVQAAHLAFSRSGSGEFRLRYSEGSHERITDFQPFDVALSANSHRKFTSFGGRSSDGVLPFFNLVNPPDGGTMLAVGWTGQWAAGFARDSGTNLTVRAGMELTRLRLHPRERIRTPSILVLQYTGDWLRGQNLFRRLLHRHYTPTLGGKPVGPLFAASPHAAVRFENTTETNMVQAIKNLASHQVPIDYWWIDAGWFNCAGNWARGVGNWDPDSLRFPNGLKPIADAAHEAGMKFILWFEPERVMPETWLFNNHPNWLLKPTTDMPAELKYQVNDKFHLLDLGNPPALAWAMSHFSKMIGRVGIDCYRNDFNLYPLYFWRNGEAPDRQGINEIKYVTGLYEFFDALRREHPHLLLDTCASGGRRIDFEMLRRALVLTRSDYLWDPVGQQCHTIGLAQWLPITGIGAASLDPYNCRSGLGTHFVLAADFFSNDSKVWESIARTVREWKGLAHLFTGDFYPLTPHSTNQSVWLSWQFDRPDLGEGLVQAFRRTQSDTESLGLKLAGLDAKTSYVVSNPDGGERYERTGRQLMEDGLTVVLKAKPSAAVLVYRRTGR